MILELMRLPRNPDRELLTPVATGLQLRGREVGPSGGLKARRLPPSARHGVGVPYRR
jgi:hypothetical protein